MDSLRSLQRARTIAIVVIAVLGIVVIALAYRGFRYLGRLHARGGDQGIHQAEMRRAVSAVEQRFGIRVAESEEVRDTLVRETAPHEYFVFAPGPPPRWFTVSHPVGDREHNLDAPYRVFELNGTEANRIRKTLR